MIIKSPTDTAALRRLWKQAFGDEDAFLDAFFATGYSPERCLCATEDGHLAAAAYWFDVSRGDKKLAYIYAVATDEIFRGRGICHRLMESIHVQLAGSGYDGAVLVPGSESLFRLYETMGYQRFGPMERITCEATESLLPLERISKEEFARLRRQLLPEGGVVQEGNLLEFLATQVAFYKGENCLLCAACRGDEAVIPELLGTENDLGGILSALGVKKGHIRRAGGSRPFAMYLPLSAGKREIPAYFALALD